MNTVKWSRELESALANGNYAAGSDRYGTREKRLMVLGPTTDKSTFVSNFHAARFHFQNTAHKVQINGRVETNICRFCKKILACHYTKRSCDVRFEDIAVTDN